MDHRSWTAQEWETAYKAVESLRKSPTRQSVFDALEVGGPVTFYDRYGYRTTGTVTVLGSGEGLARTSEGNVRFTVENIYVGGPTEEEN